MKSHLDRLSPPKSSRDLAKLLVSGTSSFRNRSGKELIFETKRLARLEDRYRLGLAQQSTTNAAACPNRAWTKALCTSLAYDVGQPPQSRASALYMRKVRRNLGGAILEFLERYSDEVRGFTLLSEQWEVSATELTPADIKRVIKQVRNHVHRLKTASRPGFVIAGLDGEFDATRKLFVLHLHGIVGGGYVVAFDRELRQRRAYRPTEFIKRPLKLTVMKEQPPWLSYVCKSFWSSATWLETEAGPKRTGRVMRIQEPDSTHYLSVLNQLRVAETFLLIGLSIEGGRLVINSSLTE